MADSQLILANSKLILTDFKLFLTDFKLIVADFKLIFSFHKTAKMALLNNTNTESNLKYNFFPAGGRLEKELEYVEASLGIGAGATNEMIIQTPNQGFSSILTPDALLTHLEVLKTASKVMVERNDVTWQLKDLCYAPTIPKTETYVIDQVS